MKTLITTVLMTLSFLLNAQQPMNDQYQIKATVNTLFINSDKHDWNGVEAQFAAKVLLDYSSMSGQPAATLTPQQITAAWKTVLPGFTHTHHQLGNMILDIDGDKAHVFAYGTATHYLQADGGNVWAVVGSYDFDLIQQDGTWKIASMRFNYKYQDGNTNLVKRAMANVSSN